MSAVCSTARSVGGLCESPFHLSDGNIDQVCCGNFYQSRRSRLDHFRKSDDPVGSTRYVRSVRDADARHLKLVEALVDVPFIFRRPHFFP
jgi:hypothetical protein